MTDNKVDLKIAALEAKEAELEAKKIEVEAKRAEFDLIYKELATLREEVARDRAFKKWALIKEHKDFFMKFLTHDRTSCSDDHVSNGWGSRSDGGCRCAKCGLIEVLNNDVSADYVDIDVAITLKQI